MSPPITLWHMAGSPPSWAVRMLADILGLELELKSVDFGAMEHKSAEMLKRNPMGTIPVLQDGDFVISESHTMMKYLLEKYGEEHKERLYPSKVRARALIDQAMYYDTGVAFIRLKIIALPALFEGEKGLTQSAIQKTEEVYGITDAYLTRTRFAAADHLTLADLSLGTSILALNGFYKVDAAKYPRVSAWLSVLLQEPYFQKIAVPGSAVLTKYVQGCWDKNSK